MDHEPPATWEPQDEDLKIVELAQGDQEYRTVSAAFFQSLPNFSGEYKIVTIRRIQNRPLFYAYATQRFQVKAQNGGDPNEVWMW